MLDLIIVGAGVAGLSASVYAQRAALEARTLERDGMGGGQLAEAVQVENYPGMTQISGFDLAQAMRRHAEALGSVFETAEVLRLIQRQSHWEVQCADGTRYKARAVIAAAGIAGQRRAGQRIIRRNDAQLDQRIHRGDKPGGMAAGICDTL